MQTSIAVIGVGMIGAAALRALSEAGAGRVLGIGTAEPADLATAEGPFASHYDHGRITRVSDPDLIWATLAQRSIAAYPTIAERGGVGFHYPVGHVRLGLPDDQRLTTDDRRYGVPLSSVVGRPSSGHDSDDATTRLRAAWTHAQALGVPIQRVTDVADAALFGEVRFPAGAEALIEWGARGGWTRGRWWRHSWPPPRRGGRRCPTGAAF